jgi:hypothetical protein
MRPKISMWSDYGAPTQKHWSSRHRGEIPIARESADTQFPRVPSLKAFRRRPPAPRRTSSIGRRPKPSITDIFQKRRKVQYPGAQTTWRMMIYHRQRSPVR